MDLIYLWQFPMHKPPPPSFTPKSLRLCHPMPPRKRVGLTPHGAFQLRHSFPQFFVHLLQAFDLPLLLFDDQ
jgi:hypothetical protein